MGSLARAGVAQLVEQRFRKPQVVRSIRIAGSKYLAHFDTARLSNRTGRSGFCHGFIWFFVRDGLHLRFPTPKGGDAFHRCIDQFDIDHAAPVIEGKVNATKMSFIGRFKITKEEPSGVYQAVESAKWKKLCTKAFSLCPFQ